MTRTVMYNAPQPENNPFGVARALQYSMVQGPVTDFPSFDGLRTIANDTASTLDLTRFRDRSAAFGVAWFGEIALDLDGTYTFELTSEGHSQLLIDGRVLVDNPGGATATTRSAPLTTLRGLRRFRLLYAELHPGSFEVWVTTPKGNRTLLDQSMFRGSIFGRGQSGIDGD